MSTPGLEAEARGRLVQLGADLGGVELLKEGAASEALVALGELAGLGRGLGGAGVACSSSGGDALDVAVALLAGALEGAAEVEALLLGLEVERALERRHLARALGGLLEALLARRGHLEAALLGPQQLERQLLAGGSRRLALELLDGGGAGEGLLDHQARLVDGCREGLLALEGRLDAAVHLGGGPLLEGLVAGLPNALGGRHQGVAAGLALRQLRLLEIGEPRRPRCHSVDSVLDALLGVGLEAQATGLGFASALRLSRGALLHRLEVRLVEQRRILFRFHVVFGGLGGGGRTRFEALAHSKLVRRLDGPTSFRQRDLDTHRRGHG